MLTDIKEFVKTHSSDIILIIGVILVSLFSFALGYIAAKYQDREPIKFEEHANSNHRGGDMRTVSGSAIG